MRAASLDLAAYLDLTTLGLMRHLVTITLRDATVLRWTDHVSDISFGDNTFVAGGTSGVPLVTVGKRIDASGTEVGECEIVLGCGDAATIGGVRLQRAALDGTLDRARVKVERVFGVDEIDTSLGALHMFEGPVADARPTSMDVTLTVASLIEDLDGVALPRLIIQPPCTAVLFDLQCALSKAAYTVTGTVAGGASDTVIPSNRAEAADWFVDGLLTFKTGALAGVERGVRAYAAGAFTLDEPLAAVPAPGDTFDVFPGCDKRKATCDTKFANLTHHRGFPALPKTRRFDRQRVTPVRPEGLPARRAAIVEEEDNEYVLPIVYGRAPVGLTPIYVYGPYVVTLPGGFVRTQRFDVLFAVCEGPVIGARRWWDPERFWDSYSQANYPGVVATQFLLGARPTQAVWVRTMSPDSTSMVGYPGVSMLGCEQRRLFDLTRPGEIEVDGFLSGTGGADGDAHAASIVQDLFPNAAYGAGVTWSLVTDTGPDGSADSSFRRYVTAAGLWISPVFDSRRKARECLADILEATNATCRCSDGALEIVPLGDAVVTGNGATYTPDLTVQYDLDADDLIVEGDEDAIEIERRPASEAFNVVPVAFNERTPAAAAGDASYAYKPRTVEDPEPRDVAKNGIRRASAVSIPMITLPDVALRLSRIKAQASARVRNLYRFRLGWRFCRLEPLDIVQVSDPSLGISGRTVRIVTIEEVDDVLEIEAEDVSIGAGHAVAHLTQSSEAGPFDGRMQTIEQAAHSLAVRNLTPRTIGSGTWTAVTYGAGRWVAVGFAGKCATSPDGITWTSRTIPASDWEDVTWTGTLFVAVAATGSKCATSPDGITWTSRTIPDDTYYAVRWNGSIVVAGGFSTIATSPDGITWTSRVTGGDAVADIAWNGSLFCTIGPLGTNYYTSPDGLTWTARARPTGNWQTIAASEATFVIAGDFGVCATSPDGITWTSQSVPQGAETTRWFKAVVWTGALFAMVEETAGAAQAAVFVSPNGKYWVAAASGVPAAGYNACCWSGEMLAAVGDSVAASSLNV